MSNGSEEGEEIENRDDFLSQVTEVVLPPIFCVNLPSSIRRKEQMQQQFDHIGATDITWIPGVYQDDPRVDLMDINAKDNMKERRSAGCWLGHVDALKAFIDRDIPEALIAEDDLWLSNEFMERYQKMRKNVPAGTPAVSLSFMAETWDGADYKGVDWGQRNLCRLNPVKIWGAQLYLMSRGFAKMAYTFHNREASLVGLKSPEGWLRRWGGKGGNLICHPPLAIEECADSDRDPECIPYHQKVFHGWGVENYYHL
jgi:hypothetical protein